MEDSLNSLITNILSSLQGFEFKVQDSMLPDREELLFYNMLKERKIYIDFDIGSDLTTIQKFIMYFNKEDEGKKPEDRKPIVIYVMSYGGDADYMFSLIDTILASETPVYTVNMGIAASAAALIFMAGSKRFMMPRSKVLIHEGSAEIKGEAVKIQDMTESYKKLLKSMKEYIVSRTLIPMNQLNKKRSNDWELDSQLCLQYGVCTSIVSSLSEII